VSGADAWRGVVPEGALLMPDVFEGAERLGIALAPESIVESGLSQYLDAVLMRASAAIRKTPDVATWSPGFSPDSTSYIPFDAAPTNTSCGRKRP
jgi:hypothetical protein